MRVILDRDDIEEAIIAYVKANILPYGDDKKINVVQERKVSAKVTFGDEKTPLLPGFEDEEQEELPKPEVTMPQVDPAEPPFNV